MAKILARNIKIISSAMLECNRSELAKLANAKPEQVSQIAQQALLLAEERKHWSRKQHLNRLIEVVEELRQEAIAKDVAIQDEREAAIDS